jgi:hypothetical protein
VGPPQLPGLQDGIQTSLIVETPRHEIKKKGKASVMA